MGFNSVFKGLMHSSKDKSPVSKLTVGKTKFFSILGMVKADTKYESNRYFQSIYNPP